MFRKWQWEYGDFLKQRGINPKFRQAMKHLIHEYSVSPKPYYWEKRQPYRIKAYMPEFDMDTNQSDTHESLDKGMQLFKELETIP